MQQGVRARLPWDEQFCVCLPLLDRSQTGQVDTGLCGRPRRLRQNLLPEVLCPVSGQWHVPDCTAIAHHATAQGLHGGVVPSLYAFHDSVELLYPSTAERSNVHREFASGLGDATGADRNSQVYKIGTACSINQGL